MPEPDTKSKEADDPSGLGCATGLAAVLVLVGAVMAWQTIAPLISWFSTRDWVETPCKILSAKLEYDEHYYVVATYSYEFNGQTFRGNTISFYGGQDNVDTFHLRTGRELEQALKNGGDFRCFVDPDEPAESVLYRTLRPRMFVFTSAFPFTFGLLGAVGLYWCWTERKRRQFARLAKAVSPKEPWLWRTDWAAGVVAPVRKGMITNTLSGIFVNAVAWPLTILLYPVGLLVSPLCLFGLYLLFDALRFRARFHRVREARLHLDVPTGVRGGAIAGRIVLPINSQPDNGFLVSLSVFHRLKRKDEEDEDVETEAARGQWQQRMSAVPESEGVTVSFWFAISERYNPVTEEKPIVWTIDIQASPPHLDCSLHFEVPVFNVEDPPWVSPPRPSRGMMIPVTLQDCLARNDGRVLEEAPDRCLVDVRPPQKWGRGIEAPRRLEYDGRTISLTKGSDQQLLVRTADVAGIHRRLSGLSRHSQKEPTPFGVLRELYEVILRMRDGQIHHLASFQRLADAKALIRSMRRVTGIANKKRGSGSTLGPSDQT